MIIIHTNGWLLHSMEKQNIFICQVSIVARVSILILLLYLTIADIICANELADIDFDYLRKSLVAKINTDNAYSDEILYKTPSTRKMLIIHEERNRFIIMLKIVDGDNYPHQESDNYYLFSAFVDSIVDGDIIVNNAGSTLDIKSVEKNIISGLIFTKPSDFKFNDSIVYNDSIYIETLDRRYVHDISWENKIKCIENEIKRKNIPNNTLIVINDIANYDNFFHGYLFKDRTNYYINGSVHKSSSDFTCTIQTAASYLEPDSCMYDYENIMRFLINPVIWRYEKNDDGKVNLFRLTAK